MPFENYVVSPRDENAGYNAGYKSNQEIADEIKQCYADAAEKGGIIIACHTVTTERVTGDGNSKAFLCLIAELPE